MEVPDLLELFVRPLDQEAIPYLIVGSVASIHYGEPRYTADIDLTLSLQTSRAKELPALFPHPDFYCPPLEVLTVELQRRERAHFNIIHLESGLKADLYPCYKQPYYEWATRNRRLLEINGRSWSFAPPEYVTLWKLMYFREGKSEKHLRDIASMLIVQGPAMDLLFLMEAITNLGLLREWDLVQTEKGLGNE